MSKYPHRKRGLILLVVLSMLTLFSLLSITYVVFSSQSRTSSMGLARRDHHRMQQDRLLDYSLQQVLRGSKDGGRSAIGPHSLLADVYGHNASADVTFTLTQARFATGVGRAEFFGNRFLRIPLVSVPATPGSAMSIPDDRDVLVGRVLTFTQGPLRNVSFRIVRSFGIELPYSDLNHSVIIDLMDAANSNNSVQNWISGGALALCQNSTAGYSIRINDRETNALGFGVRANGSTLQVEQYPPSPTTPIMEVSFLPLHQALSSRTGDTDESYDAPDYNDVWLAHRRSGATQAQDIIPSFHRAALINYIVNKESDLRNTTAFTQAEFLEMLDLIERACPRPLGISVVNLEGGIPNYSSLNRDFAGSNLGAVGRTPTLDINLRSRWTNWTVPAAPGAQTPHESFLSFVRFLTTGPWDVDNDGDGMQDGVWVDLDMPLMTSPEGKLLKMLTSYYILDLDSRLDLNAVGNLHQTTDPTYNPSTTNAFTAGGMALPQGFGIGPADSSLRHLFASDTDYVSFLEARYGGANGTPGEGSSTAIAALIDDARSRLDGGGNVFNPLTAAMQNTGTRERRQIFAHNQLPGFPVAIRGAEALGFDRLGNPLLSRGTSATIANQGMEDPYESRLLDTPHSDLPFTIAEWERIYRKYDWDVSMLPRRLKPLTLLESNVNAVTPRSAHMRNIPLAGLSPSSNPIDSLYELIYRIGQTRTSAIPTPPSTLTSDMFREVFPFEFGRGMPLDLNRPFGNGIDDDMDGQIDEPEELLTNRFDDDSDGLIDELDERTIAHRQGAVYMSNGVAQVSNSPEYATFDDGYASGRMDPLYEGFVTSAPTTTAVFHHGQQGRQLLARNLYCLAMLLLPDDLYVSNRPGIALTGEDRARALAQWAVNVIDFRDADHAMTRFPYDPHPFEKRGAPGVEPYFWMPNVDDTGAPVGEVVWGMEQPELLLTETLATHDLRVRDTVDDDDTGKSTTSATEPDDDFDQYRIPEGSLFLEFFCPRTTSTPTDATVPGTGSSMYVAGATNLELNLNALSPSDGATRYPVWRVAFTAPHLPSAPSAEAMRSAGTNQTLSYQLAVDAAEVNLNGLRYDFAPAAAGPPSRPLPSPQIDRILWFSSLTSPGVDAEIAAVGLPTSIPPVDRPAHVFGNQDTTGALSIQGGQYLVVGPRQSTYFGSQQLAASSHTNLPNNHRIVLENAVGTSGSLPVPDVSWANVYLGDNQRVEKRVAMRDCVSMVAATRAPWTFGGTTNLAPTIGISVSEPIAKPGVYYDAPTQFVNSSNTTAAANGAPGFAATGVFKDGYHDYASSPASPQTPLPDTPFDADPATPIGQHYAPTHPAVGGVGVAEPGTQLDWCTAYLQRLADPERPWHAALNPYITVDWMPIDLTVFSGEDTIADSGFRFGSRQKNGQVAAALRGRTFLSYDSDAPLTSVASGTTNFFNDELEIDNATGAIVTKTQVPRPTPETTNFATLGYLNSPFELLNEPTIVVPGLPEIFLGSPATAPQSLTWFNRPFASPFELMLVPLCAPGQLMQEFSSPNLSSDVAAVNQYAAPAAGNVFTHLPNFFQAPATPNRFSPSVLFELITTPSQWSDSDSIVPPSSLAAILPASGRDFTAMGSLVPPYNRVSRMVERGRLNINTVSDEAAWQGVEWNYANTGTRSAVGPTGSWSALEVARRIYAPDVGVIPSGNTRLNSNYPTEFPGVFKSQLAVGLVPTTRSTPNVLDTGGGITASLLRKNATANGPLFSIRSDLSTAQAQAFNEYLPITRLANLTSTRSNVFAIYMTVAYFEYDPSSGISQEYGWDNGKTRRHRGFYVVDRSIPVNYEPGEDHNTDKCVLMRRIIE